MPPKQAYDKYLSENLKNIPYICLRLSTGGVKHCFLTIRSKLLRQRLFTGFMDVTI